MPLSHAAASFLRAPLRGWRNVKWFFPLTISRDIDPIFILGTPRSGTTLLQNLLCAHSELCGPAGETSGVFMFRDAFEPRYADFTPEQQLALLDSSRDVIDFFVAYARGVCAREGAATFVDKMVGVSPYFIRLVSRHLPRARFLYISRDGRDAFCSAREHPHIPQRESIAAFARLYARNEARRRRWLSPLATHFHLKYEDLVAQPAASLAKLMRFLDLTLEPQQLATAASGRSADFSQARYHDNLENSITPRSVGRFRRDLSPDHIAEFELHAGPALRRLGYEPTASI